MQKKILFGKDSMVGIRDGVNKVADAVCITLGPNGKTVIISKQKYENGSIQYWQPICTKDGITVAKNITLDDMVENAGCLMIREASDKTMAESGDGTTTTCLFVQEIVNAGLDLIEKGSIPRLIKKDIDNAVIEVVSELKSMAVTIGEDFEKIKQIATISANNDPVIGALIADAFRQIGVGGIVNIEETKGTKTEIKVEDGFRFDRGWLSPYFITNAAKNEVVLEDVTILLYDKKLIAIKPLMNILDKVMAKRKPLLIICEDAEGEAMASIAMNSADPNVSFKACIVRSPGFADAKREMMEDIALLTGGFYISDEKGTSLEKAFEAQLGTAKKVIVSKDETIILGGGGDKDKISSLIYGLKESMKDAEGEEKDAIETRIAKLTGGVATLYVGAATETEMKEKKDRCDDAVRATKSAIAEGYVPGGGSAFIHISKKIGNNILSKLLESPLRKICSNGGIKPDSIITAIEQNGVNYGYNAKDDVVEDLIESGIIDPVKVLRSALENGASTATMIITSACHIADSM